MLRRTKMVRSKILCLFEKMDLPRASEAEAAKVTVSFSQASAVPATMAWQCRDRLHDGAPSPHLQGGMTVDCGQLSRLVPLSWRCLADGGRQPSRQALRSVTFKVTDRVQSHSIQYPRKGLKDGRS